MVADAESLGDHPPKQSKSIKNQIQSCRKLYESMTFPLVRGRYLGFGFGLVLGKAYTHITTTRGTSATKDDSGAKEKDDSAGGKTSGTTGTASSLLEAATTQPPTTTTTGGAGNADAGTQVVDALKTGNVAGLENQAVNMAEDQAKQALGTALGGGTAGQAAGAAVDLVGSLVW